MKLPLPDHLCWLALRRVKRGGVAKVGDRYVEGGLPLGVLLADLLGELLVQDLLTVADPDPADGLARVSLTEAGRSHYRTLCQQQRGPRPMPPPQFATAIPTPQPNNSTLASIKLPTETTTGHQSDSTETGPPDVARSML